MRAKIVSHSESTDPRQHVVTDALQIKDLRKFDPDALMGEGLKWHEICVGKIMEGKIAAGAAGLAFLTAKRLQRRGDWSDFCAANNVRRALADHYIRFAEYLIEVGRMDAQIEDEEAAYNRGMERVMPSPKPWTAVLRYAGLLEKQGQYSPERYAEQQRAKTLDGHQLEFDFSHVFSALNDIGSLEVYPTVSADQLEALEQELAKRLEQVRALRLQMETTIPA